MLEWRQLPCENDRGTGETYVDSQPALDASYTPTAIAALHTSTSRRSYFCSNAVANADTDAKSAMSISSTSGRSPVCAWTSVPGHQRTSAARMERQRTGGRRIALGLAPAHEHEVLRAHPRKVFGGLEPEADVRARDDDGLPGEVGRLQGQPLPLRAHEAEEGVLAHDE
jgi:hypothetical protein